ncbi:MAG: alanine--glyoxylate aminotransferase family protein [Eubacteriaceae bacterium]|nr:alanine--glyoxylate aminotransferase family protein [Eubacteriaceae bacterium]
MTKQHIKLFIPGPVEVRPEVLEKMATPLIGHRTKDASALQKGISDKLRQLFYTQNEILLSTSSGTGLMEGAIRCGTAKRAAVFSVGSFGKRWYELAINNNVEADLFEVPDGQPTDPAEVDRVLATGKYDLVTITHNETSAGLTNDCAAIGEVIKKYPDVLYCVDAVSSAAGVKIEVDKWGIDVCITSSQKALGLPPGLAICTFSPKAVERAKQVKNRGYYLDLLSLYNTIQKKNYQYPSTPTLSHMFALDYQLDCILEEGLDNRFARHKEMADYIRAWANEYFEVFPAPEYASNTVTCVKNTRNIDVAAFRKALNEKGYEISDGYGDLKGKTFRIAHMADMTMDDMKDLVAVMNEVLGF